MEENLQRKELQDIKLIETKIIIQKKEKKAKVKKEAINK